MTRSREHMTSGADGRTTNALQGLGQVFVFWVKLDVAYLDRW